MKQIVLGVVVQDQFGVAKSIRSIFPLLSPVTVNSKSNQQNKFIFKFFFDSDEIIYNYNYFSLLFFLITYRHMDMGH